MRAGIGQELEPRLAACAEYGRHGSFQRRCDLLLDGDAASRLGLGLPIVGLVAARTGRWQLQEGRRER